MRSDPSELGDNEGVNKLCQAKVPAWAGTLNASIRSKANVAINWCNVR